MAKIPKQVALYVFMHQGRTAYECRDCNMFIPGRDRCTIHGPSDVIEYYGSCSYFIYGKPMGGKPMGEVDKLTSGYADNLAKVGFSCKRCEYFDGEGDCKLVDKDSIGPTNGLIHPNACCNGWQPDKERGSMTDEQLARHFRGQKIAHILEAHGR